MKNMDYTQFKVMVLKAIFAWMTLPFEQGSAPDGYALELHDKISIQDYGEKELTCCYYLSAPPKIVDTVNSPSGGEGMSAVAFYIFFAGFTEYERSFDEGARAFHQFCLIDHQFVDVTKMPDITDPVNLDDYLPETIEWLKRYEALYDAGRLHDPELDPLLAAAGAQKTA